MVDVEAPFGHARGLFETGDELTALNALSDSSFACAGEHLTGIITGTGRRRVTSLAIWWAYDTLS